MKDKLIVFKIGTSSLTNHMGDLDAEKLAQITSQLAQLHHQGYQLVLVTSGSIAAGFRRLGFDKRPKHIADKQASAAVGQGLLIEHYTTNLMQDGIVSAQVLLTQDDFKDPRRYNNAAQALQVLLKRRAIPIINENDTIAVDEIKVGDNDTLSAQVAGLLKADLLVLLTDVAGLYTANPRKDPQAQAIARVDNITPELFQIASGAGTANGTGGMVTKIQAARLATMAGVPVFITSSQLKNSLPKAVKQEIQGTYFTAQTKAFNQKKQWLAFYAPSQADIFVDAGAEKAMVAKGHSLLLSGISEFSGNFQRNDIVSVYSQTSGKLIGKGRARFSRLVVEELLQFKHPEGTFIHRDDWVTLL
ncbi:glutamate 5-kinase [Ligilactobacillus equi]|uniref:Glutamate 5-kinase n=1 Tax=Ligilactobacillus equi DPC 6820 TaxID=1392007 RepID=V7HVR5_9LACO|nr:glutamate 5-kinase [Ligilactobacillus equi]ETA73308.1 glutamate 5-kinase (gamma-glutamyl kinasgk) [Ligilactobacillus equi DPC 6820]